MYFIKYTQKSERIVISNLVFQIVIYLFIQNTTNRITCNKYKYKYK